MFLVMHIRLQDGQHQSAAAHAVVLLFALLIFHAVICAHCLVAFQRLCALLQDGQHHCAPAHEAASGGGGVLCAVDHAAVVCQVQLLPLLHPDLGRNSACTSRPVYTSFCKPYQM